MRNWESRFSLFYETKPGNRLNQGFSHAHEGIRGCYEGIKALPTFQPTEHRPSMRGTGEYVKQSVPLLLRILLFFNDAVSLALATCCKNRETLSGSYAMANQSISTVTTKRPNIGLVLKGGGALGLAHIGVIQWLEEHRIPVSYVAGTSMGGLVGGWYATGRSDAEVRQVVQTINWDEVLRAQTLFPDLAFRRKEDD